MVRWPWQKRKLELDDPNVKWLYVYAFSFYPAEILEWTDKLVHISWQQFSRQEERWVKRNDLKPLVNVQQPKRYIEVDNLERAIEEAVAAAQLRAKPLL